MSKYAKATGQFDKGVKGSVSLNFCLSGGKYCDTVCRQHPSNGGACYALRPQGLYPSMAASLSAKEGVDPGDIAEQAIGEVKRKNKPIPWFRFSVAGSLPPRNQVTPKLRDKLVELVEWLRHNNVPIHMPVESHSKAGYYQGLLGDRVVVRLSVQNPEDFLTYEGPCSLVVGGGEKHRKGNSIMQQRIAASRAVAKARRQLTGRATMVCPAIKGLRDKNKSKCGKCKACSMPHVDVVYPLH